MAYAMRTPAGIWIWSDPPPTDLATPVILAGVGGEADLAQWAAQQHIPLPSWRDHPAVPALGMSRYEPVWLGTLPDGPWVTWTPAGQWALSTTYPDLRQALAALRHAGRPWRLWTPPRIWEARTAPGGVIDPRLPWYLGQTPTGGVFAWQRGVPPGFVRAGSAPDAPPYEWPAVRPAAAFLHDQGRVVQGFCPRAIARHLTRTRAVSRLGATL